MFSYFFFSTFKVPDQLFGLEELDRWWTATRTGSRTSSASASPCPGQLTRLPVLVHVLGAVDRDPSTVPEDDAEKEKVSQRFFCGHST